MNVDRNALTWRELEGAAPEIARLGRERLEGVGVAFLGTLRPDGRPRISPVEAHVARGHLLIGVMPRSLKLRDLERDRRCTLQSAVTDPDSGEGELKLYGRANEVGEDELRASADRAWWARRPREDATVFSFEIDEAAFVSWEVERGEMTVRTWSPRRGARTATRPYP
jgi:hypothetical protein